MKGMINGMRVSSVQTVAERVAMESMDKIHPKTGMKGSVSGMRIVSIYKR
jgi:hypothetical protein